MLSTRYRLLLPQRKSPSYMYRRPQRLVFVTDFVQHSRIALRRHGATTSRRHRISAPTASARTRTHARLRTRVCLVISVPHIKLFCRRGAAYHLTQRISTRDRTWQATAKAGADAACSTSIWQR